MAASRLEFLRHHEKISTSFAMVAPSVRRHFTVQETMLRGRPDSSNCFSLKLAVSYHIVARGEKVLTIDQNKITAYLQLSNNTIARAHPIKSNEAIEGIFQDDQVLIGEMLHKPSIEVV